MLRTNLLQPQVSQVSQGSFLQSISPFQIMFILILVAAVVYYIYSNISSENKDMLTTLTPLNKKKDIMMPDTVQSDILGSGGSTVMGFFSLNAGDRTMAYDNEYVPVIQVENNWSLEIAQAPKKDISARLKVKTSNGGVSNIEYIELPAVPKQKWVFIAILREGRRFDVIYNNQIVASKHLKNYPVVISSPLSVGNSKLDGNVIHVIVNKRRMTPNEVERQRRVYVDTNNDILEDNYIFPSFPTLKLFGICPSGLSCDSITQPPPNVMNTWSTPYA